MTRNFLCKLIHMISSYMQWMRELLLIQLLTFKPKYFLSTSIIIFVCIWHVFFCLTLSYLHVELNMKMVNEKYVNKAQQINQWRMGWSENILTVVSICIQCNMGKNNIYMPFLEITQHIISLFPIISLFSSSSCCYCWS